MNIQVVCKRTTYTYTSISRLAVMGVVVHIIHVYTLLGSLCFVLHNDCRTCMIYDIHVCHMLVSPIDIFFKSQDFSTDTHFTAILTKCLTTFLDVIIPSKVCLSLSLSVYSLYGLLQCVHKI